MTTFPAIAIVLFGEKYPVLKKEPILETSLSYLDTINGGFKGAPKFPSFNLFETLLYFYNKTKNNKYLKPVNLILTQLCSKGIYDHVEGGISRYTVDENWIIPHFEKMLYDNVQFVLLLSKYCKIHRDDYFKYKLEQTIEFLIKDLLCYQYLFHHHLVLLNKFPYQNDYNSFLIIEVN